MKFFSGLLGLAAVGFASILSGCHPAPPENVAVLPPSPAPKKDPVYTDFTIVRQPDTKSRPRGSAWGQIVVGLPKKYQNPNKKAPDPVKGKPVPPKKPIGSARLVDDAGHVMDLGSIPPPDPGDTEFHFYVTRGFPWKWNHPHLELTLFGEPPKTIPLKDLPEPEEVKLPKPSEGSPFVCELIPNLESYGIYGGDNPKPGVPGPGFLIWSHQPMAPDQEKGEACQMVLGETPNAAGLNFPFFDVEQPKGSGPVMKFVAFRLAPATKLVLIHIRRIKNVEETQEISFPGCELVSKFGATGFKVDKPITVKGSNGWTFTLPAQYSGPFRTPRSDSRSIEIKLTVKAPDVVAVNAPPGKSDDDAPEDSATRAFSRSRRGDTEREGSSVVTDLVSPVPGDLGLSKIWMLNHTYLGSKKGTAVKYGPFTLKLRFHTTTVKELGTETVTLPVQQTTRHPASAGA